MSKERARQILADVKIDPKSHSAETIKKAIAVLGNSWGNNR